MVNYSLMDSYNSCTDCTKSAASSSYANNYYAIAMDIAILAVSIFVIALISLISIIITFKLILVLLVIIIAIREAGKQSTKSTMGPFIILT